ncbi:MULTISPECIES: nuclear transport factor 2 family protein [Galbibacter]|uniref:Nuclear transport factor 2 family protein n=1 Tax=Galbibacter pacificus TaxID=2996052 RepID=A0ABT6FQD0_9FLAO|nr:nuclear transport factor 2 family protein [Galbibacter pacificus]MDG3582218.1 nuclear transport factor 2 family protein [Galbibacter pacificus]MDG3585306.1 nuclear transport factor 2 family protein [Galbibacter pacificus]
MAQSIKKIVQDFYQSEPIKNNKILKEYLHDDCQLFWNSSKGFTKLNKEELISLAMNMAEAYHSIRTEISHLLRDGNSVTVRYTYHVKAIETPDEEQPLAHFITIWECKDDKLYRGYEISQLADDNPVNLNSFLPVKQ